MFEALGDHAFRHPRRLLVAAGIAVALCGALGGPVAGKLSTSSSNFEDSSSQSVAARHLIAAACWAKEVWVVPSTRYAHMVTLEIVRKQYSERTGPTPDPWPYSRYLDGDPADDAEGRNTPLSWWKPAA